MRLLVVGGSKFVGRHVVEAAVADGHEVWLANRGETTTETFGAAGRLTIDRATDDLGALGGEAFDAVIDVSAYIPRHVTALHDVLGDRVGWYLLVSTVSVYDAAAMADDPTESAPRQLAEHDTEEVTSETYGPLKVACEEAAHQRWDDRLTVVRPGIVAGPHDHTDRFTWWVRHLATTRPTPLPDRRDQPVQVIDARDLAAFCLRLVADRTRGSFDATGEVLTLEALVDAVLDGVGGVTDEPVRWVDPSRWGEISLPPLVLDPSWGQDALFQRDSVAAPAAGLTRRPVSVTAEDTRAWDVAIGQPSLAAGPSAEELTAL
ncbi:NAD-dependent epimerase/dehydratase family protein [Euzebya sp.]|uniref:NAD-dependent epimerase/dehydratase family protein n=1 Tax=Euzebya sp. TaxID=1971409 RepID=UPI003512F336